MEDFEIYVRDFKKAMKLCDHSVRLIVSQDDETGEIHLFHGESKEDMQVIMYALSDLANRFEKSFIDH